MRTRRRRPRPKHVFLNCPFDPQYEDLFLALIAGVTGLGLTPRCVLEIPPTRARLDRLVALIEQCSSSIHDLSRVELSSRAPRLPRFNMPFELGLAVALSLSGARHRWYLFEARPYRLQATLSDVNGFDPHVHHGTATGVLRALTDAFVRRRAQPSVAQLARAHRALRAFWADLRRRERVSLFSPRAFRDVVVASARIAERLGLS